MIAAPPGPLHRSPRRVTEGPARRPETCRVDPQKREGNPFWLEGMEGVGRVDRKRCLKGSSFTVTFFNLKRLPLHFFIPGCFERVNRKRSLKESSFTVTFFNLKKLLLHFFASGF